MATPSKPSGWNPPPVWNREEKYEDWHRRVRLWRDAFPLDTSNVMLIAQLIQNSFERRDDHLREVLYDWYESTDLSLGDGVVDTIIVDLNGAPLAGVQLTNAQSQLTVVTATNAASLQSAGGTATQPQTGAPVGGTVNPANVPVGGQGTSTGSTSTTASQQVAGNGASTGSTAATALQPGQTTSSTMPFTTIKKARDSHLKAFLQVVKDKTHGVLEFQMLEDIMKFQRIVRVESESMSAYLQRFHLWKKRVELHGLKMDPDMTTLVMLANSRLPEEEIRNLLRLPRTLGKVAPDWSTLVQEVRRIYHSDAGPILKQAKYSAWYEPAPEEMIEDVQVGWDTSEVNDLELYNECGEPVTNDDVCAYLARKEAFWVESKKRGKWNRVPFQKSNKNWHRNRSKSKPRRDPSRDSHRNSKDRFRSNSSHRGRDRRNSWNRRKSSNSRPRRDQSFNRNRSPGPPWKGKDEKTRGKIVCWHCGKSGHVSSKCYKSKKAEHKRNQGLMARALQPKVKSTSLMFGYLGGTDLKKMLGAGTNSVETVLVPKREVSAYGVVDSGCNSSVCGLVWYNAFARRARRYNLKTKKIGQGQNFGFGGDHSKKSLFKAEIETLVQGRKISIQVDVCEGQMPLLLSEDDLGTLGVDVMCTASTIAIDGVLQQRCTREEHTNHLLLFLLDCESRVQKALAAVARGKKQDGSSVMLDACRAANDSGCDSLESETSVSSSLHSHDLSKCAEGIGKPVMMNVTTVHRKVSELRLSVDLESGRSLYQLVSDTVPKRLPADRRLMVLGKQSTPDGKIVDKVESQNRILFRELREIYEKSLSGSPTSCAIFWKPRFLFHENRADEFLTSKILALAKNGDTRWFEASDGVCHSQLGLDVTELQLGTGRFHAVILFYNISPLMDDPLTRVRNITHAKCMIVDKTSQQYLWLDDQGTWSFPTCAVDELSLRAAKDADSALAILRTKLVNAVRAQTGLSTMLEVDLVPLESVTGVAQEGSTYVFAARVSGLRCYLDSQWKSRHVQMRDRFPRYRWASEDIVGGITVDTESARLYRENTDSKTYMTPHTAVRGQCVCDECGNGHPCFRMAHNGIGSTGFCVECSRFAETKQPCGCKCRSHSKEIPHKRAWSDDLKNADALTARKRKVCFDLESTSVKYFEKYLDGWSEVNSAFNAASMDVELQTDSLSADAVDESKLGTEFNSRELLLLQKAVDAEESRITNLSGKVRDSLTKEKMIKLHQQFGHPSDQKLQYLLEWNGMDRKKAKLLTCDLTKKCGVCEYTKQPPHRPISSAALYIGLGEVLECDLWFPTQQMPILTICDRGTGFLSGGVLRNKTSEEVIRVFRTKWSMFGTPRIVRFDPGGEFNSDEFYAYLRSNDIVPEGTASQGHWQVGSAERANALIKEHFVTLRESFPNEEPEVLLQEALNAHNQLSTHKGLPPCVRVFGFVPRAPSVLDMRSEASLLDRETDAVGTANVVLLRQRAREMYVQLQASTKLKTAVSRNLRQGSKTVVKMHDRVYYYRHHPKTKKYTGWFGPGYVCGLDRGAVLVRHGARVFSVPPNFVRSAENGSLPTDELAVDEHSTGDITLVGLDGTDLEIDVANVEDAVQEMSADTFIPPVPEDSATVDDQIHASKRKRPQTDVLDPRSEGTSSKRCPISPEVQRNMTRNDEPSPKRRSVSPEVQRNPRRLEETSPKRRSVSPEVQRYSRHGDDTSSKRRSEDPEPSPKRRSESSEVQRYSRRDDDTSSKRRSEDPEPSPKRRSISPEVQRNSTSRSSVESDLNRSDAPEQYDDPGLGPNVVKRGRGRPKGSKDSQKRKSRKAANTAEAGSVFNSIDIDQDFSEQEFLSMTQGTECLGVDMKCVESLNIHLGCEEAFVGAFVAAVDTAETNVPVPSVSSSKTRDATKMERSKTKTVPSAEATGPEWDLKRREEFQGLLDYRTLEPMKVGALLRQKQVRSLRDLNVMNMIWVFTIKTDGRYKARLCVQGSADAQKGKILSASPTLTRESFRTVLFILAQQKWECLSGDVPQAFLQSDPEFWDREIYVIPPPMMGFANDDIFLLKKAVYGLIDAPLQWWATVDDWMQTNGLQRSMFDPTVFLLKSDNNKLDGIVGVAVDDTLWGGNDKMHKLMAKFAKKFSVKSWESSKGVTRKFLGQDVLQHDDWSIEMDQDHYIREHLKEIVIEPHRTQLSDDTVCTKAEVKQLQAGNGVAIWVIAQTRIDAACQVSMVAGEIGRNPTLGTIKRFNRCVNTIQSRKMKVIYKSLGNHASDFELVVYHDAAFGNLPEGGSQGGVILAAIPQNVLTQDLFYKEASVDIPCVPLFWKSFRIKRVARSTFAGETLSAMEGLDLGQFFRCMLEEILGTHIPVTHVTDCKSVKDSVDSIVPATTEKNLKRDVYAIREAITENRVKQFLWCDTKHMVCDALTKVMDVDCLVRMFSKSVLKVGQSREQTEKQRKRKEKQALRASRSQFWSQWRRKLGLQGFHSD